MVVPMDGLPVYRPVEKTDLERVLNTRALILRAKSGQLLSALVRRLRAGREPGRTLDRPGKSPVRGQARPKSQAVKAKQVDLLAGQENPATKEETLPQINAAPRTLHSIRAHGADRHPGRASVDAHTGHKFILCQQHGVACLQGPPSQKNYLLISGRWFRPASFDGPWEFVPGAALPKDFAAIPDDSPKENVKASVPGTRQSLEAAIANGIPNTVKVDRKKATMDPAPEYEGPPRLAPITARPWNTL